MSEAKELGRVSSNESEWIGRNGPLLPRRRGDRLDEEGQKCQGGSSTLGELSAYCVDSSGQIFFFLS